MIPQGSKMRFVVVLLAMLMPASTAGQEVSDAQMRDIYRSILRDPSNPELNTRYARLAIERGELRKALAAYERILAADPDNEAARAGLRRVQRMLEPDYTRATLLLGAQYERNPLRVKEPGDTADEGVFFLRGELVDERGFGALRWRSGADLFSNFHVDLTDLDFGNVRADTGPVLPLGDRFQIHPHVGGGYAWFDQRSFFAEALGGISLEPVEPGIFNSARAGVRYDFIADSFSSRDAVIFELESRFILRSQSIEDDVVIFNPYYSYHGVVGSGGPAIGPRGQEFPLTFHQVGLRSYYFVELMPDVTGSLNFTVEYRHYFEQVTRRTNNRRDVYISPGAQLIFSGAFTDRTDVILHYTFELNTSNDPFERYLNHVAGVMLLWRL